MKRIIFLFFIFIFISACSNGNSRNDRKRTIKNYSEKTILLKDPLELDLDCDSGKIEVFTWERKEIKFEMTKNLRISSQNSNIENEFKKLSTDINQDENHLMFKSKYTGNINAPEDKILYLDIYIPRDMRYIKCNLANGDIRFQDDIDSDLDISIDTASVNINRLEGRIKLMGNRSNLSIGSGVLKDGSSINIIKGNIDIKSELEPESKYDIKTETGNINLRFPSDTMFNLSGIGALYSEFNSTVASTDLQVRSDIGSISISKYID